MQPTERAAWFDPGKKGFALFENLKSLGFKGDAIDLAVGCTLGGAFGKLIDSLVKHVILPLAEALLPGRQGYLGWTWEVQGKEVPYGLFLGEVVKFLVVALALFVLVVKLLGWVTRAKRQGAAAPPPLTNDQE
jgi:large conductance mechanosensitive channel